MQVSERASVTPVVARTSATRELARLNTAFVQIRKRFAYCV